MGRAIKFALNRAAADSNLSREELVFSSNQLAKESGVSLCAGNGCLSISTLNKWLDPSADGYLPGVIALTVLCLVLKNNSPLFPFLESLNLKVMTHEDQKYRDLGKLETELKCLRKKKRLIEELV